MLYFSFPHLQLLSMVFSFFFKCCCAHERPRWRQRSVDSCHQTTAVHLAASNRNNTYLPINHISSSCPHLFSKYSLPCGNSGLGYRIPILLNTYQIIASQEHCSDGVQIHETIVNFVRFYRFVTSVVDFPLSLEAQKRCTRLCSLVYQFLPEPSREEFVELCSIWNWVAQQLYIVNYASSFQYTVAVKVFGNMGRGGREAAGWGRATTRAPSSCSSSRSSTKASLPGLMLGKHVTQIITRSSRAKTSSARRDRQTNSKDRKVVKKRHKTIRSSVLKGAGLVIALSWNSKDRLGRGHLLKRFKHKVVVVEVLLSRIRKRMITHLIIHDLKKQLNLPSSL